MKKVNNDMLRVVVCDLPIGFCDLEVDNNMLILDVCDLPIGFCDLQIEVYNVMLIGISVI